MKFFATVAATVFLILTIGLFLLKFIKPILLRCLAIKHVTWGSMCVKLMGSKIAVEIDALTIQLALLPGNVPIFSTTDSLPTAVKSCTSTVDQSNSVPNLMENALSSLGITGKVLTSYLFSCLTIVLTNSVLEFESFEGELLQV